MTKTNTSAKGKGQRAKSNPTASKLPTQKVNMNCITQPQMLKLRALSEKALSRNVLGNVKLSHKDGLDFYAILNQIDKQKVTVDAVIDNNEKVKP